MVNQIYINGAVLGTKRHGISRYTAQLLSHLVEINSPQFEFSVFTGGGTQFEKISQVNIDVSGTLERVAWDSVKFPNRAKSEGADAIHSPDKGPFLKQGMPTVATIHDLLPYLYPDERPIPNRKYWQLSLRRQATLSDAIVTVSESTKQDLIDIFDVEPDQVHVTPLGTSFSSPSNEEVEQVQEIYDISPSRFNILYVGNYNHRKNVDQIVDACRMVSEEGADIQTLLAGSKPPKTQLREIAGSFHDRLTFLGYVPDERLEALYGAADLFVYPSSYEGFGLPVLEAMACGTPVITSNASSLPEVVGKAGSTVDPADSEQLADEITCVYLNERLQQKMRKDGLARAEQFNWENTAKETINSYRTIL